MKKLVLILSTICLMAHGATAETIKVTSPEGRITLSLCTDGALSYNVVFNGRAIVADSPLGFEFKGEKPMSAGFVLTQPCTPKLHTDAWDPVVKNKHAHVKLLYNEAVLHMQEAGGNFLKIVPTTWDDTRFICGYPGEHIALAKRSGDSWFIGAMTNSQPREFELTLDFLEPGQYEIEYWADGKKADKIATELVHKTARYDTTKPLKVRMAAGGGYVAILKRL